MNNPYELSEALAGGGGHSGCGYVEAQYHGDVTVANGDFSSIIMYGTRNNILKGSKSDPEIFKKIIKKANDLGINVLVGEPYGNQLFLARFDDDGEIVYNLYESEVIRDD